MAEINIPGVSDKYKTNDLVKNLMEVERVPLTREQSKLDNYKLERECWQRVNQYMTSVHRLGGKCGILIYSKYRSILRKEG